MMHRMLKTAILITFGLLIIGIIGGCDDDPPEVVTAPSQPEDDVGPASATEVVMDPPPRTNTGRVLYVSSNTEFTLTFNEGVVAVTVNGTPATGSGSQLEMERAALFTLWICKTEDRVAKPRRFKGF